AVARRPLQPERLLAFFQACGFRSLVGRIAEVAKAATEARETAKSAGERPNFLVVSTLENLDRILATALDQGVLAIDTETTSQNIAQAELVGICIAVDDGRGFYVPLCHVDE